ncbi:hypothetical protein EJ08DRAFT_179544 [Tothia fuscella]|uniref:Uncharacterized protein n=1 Tax=Tothia fuscella TaxID=1048955 RepID=A0A9P4TYL1_9PEZI|nr:hypothetical protein EJ08DRAFT_179544 [Tothia fuscella]
MATNSPIHKLSHELLEKIARYLTYDETSAFIRAIRSRSCHFVRKSQPRKFFRKATTAAEYGRLDPGEQKLCRPANPSEYPPEMIINPFISERIWVLDTSNGHIWWYQSPNAEENTRIDLAVYLYSLCSKLWSTSTDIHERSAVLRRFTGRLHPVRDYHSFMPMAATWRPVVELHFSFNGLAFSLGTPILHDPMGVSVGQLMRAVLASLCAVTSRNSRNDRWFCLNVDRIRQLSDDSDMDAFERGRRYDAILSGEAPDVEMRVCIEFRLYRLNIDDYNNSSI